MHMYFHCTAVRIQKKGIDQPGPEPGISGGALQVSTEALHLQLGENSWAATAPVPLWAIFDEHQRETSERSHRLES